MIFKLLQGDSSSSSERNLITGKQLIECQIGVFVHMCVMYVRAFLLHAPLANSLILSFFFLPAHVTRYHTRSFFFAKDESVCRETVIECTVPSNAFDTTNSLYRSVPHELLLQMYIGIE